MFNKGTKLSQEHGYEIQRLLSEKGGMGLVYLATDLNMRSTVVIKYSRFNETAFLRRIFPNLTPQQLKYEADMMRDAFKHEACLLFGLRHSALPRALNYFETDQGDQFFVMEFIPGKDLSELLDERLKDALGPFPLGQVLDWADQLLDVLDYLHTEFGGPIVHRDIKPQNLKRIPSGRVVLLDFGLAKGAHPDMTSVAKSVPGHTWPYSAPEQISGAGTTVRSDLYSLAVTLHQLLTGQVPPSSVDRALNEKQDPLRPAHEANPQVPVAISEILHRGAALWPDERYASAAEMRDALRLAASATEGGRGVQTTVPSGYEGEVTVRDQWVRAAGEQMGVPESVIEDLGNDVKLEMVGIRGGSFMMGTAGGEAPANEQPPHLVTLSPFFIGRFPTTQAQWRELMDDNPGHFIGDDLPVEGVSWHDAVKFCQLLSQRTGRNYRLLTEAEWEYACRAGSAGAFSFGDDEGSLGQHAWYEANSDQRSRPVGQKLPNSWGLHEMHGNVWEWCGDWYAEDYYGRSPELDPPGPDSGQARVLRGGSWSDSSFGCRAAFRNSGVPFHRSDIIGFRVGLSAGA